MNKIISIGTLAICFISINKVQAQVSYQNESLRTEQLMKGKNGLYFNWYNNNYFKNNEYFLNTAVGYTLFGTQNIASLGYKFNKHLSVSGGVYLRKDFGNDGYKTKAPYYLVSLSKNGYSIDFGNINGGIGHRMYDPIFANERLITNNLEEGFSLKVRRRKIQSETWINWEKQQYMFANYNEQFTVGHNSNILLYRNKRFQLKLPIQGLIVHSGGQLDTTTKPTVSLANASLGLNAAYRFSRRKVINEIGFNANYLVYKDLDANSGLAFTQGNAIYANLNVRFLKNFTAVFSYWKGHHFIAPKGDILYQSISHNPRNLGYLEPERQLIQLGLAYEKVLAKYARFSVRANPFYDVQNSRVDYSYSMFITLQPSVLIAKQKRNIKIF